MHLTSSSNPRIKELLALRDRSARDLHGLFLIEGYREIKRALQAGRPISSLFYCEELFLGENESEIINGCGTERYSCSKQLFERISYRDRPDGLIAVAPQIHLGKKELLDFLKECKDPLFLVVERVEKPGNLGTMLRTADAAGASGVIVCDQVTDIHNPNVVRASVGTLFAMPIYELSSVEALEILKTHGVAVAAATPHAEKEFTKAKFNGPLAIAVGSEQYGLSNLWMDQADIQVRIPMLGIADSLNVSAAATLLLYEAVRQRKS
jgi:TrmH family RNA methyltransferase